MLIALFDAMSRHLRHDEKTMIALQLMPRAALKTGARRLASGVAPLLRKEVAVWALLQSVAVWSQGEP